jgi:DNA polymerase-1
MVSVDDYSLENKGITLHINKLIPKIYDVCAIDVETDEKDNFVGYALCGDDKNVYYYSNPNKLQKHLDFVGHNIKFDLHFLHKNGIEIALDKVVFDTMLASYYLNPVKVSHGLKTLAKELLNFVYPTYAEMVGKGKTKITLDKQSIEVVANYCGSDAWATMALYRKFTSFGLFNTPQFQTLMNLMKILYQMESQKPSLIDVDYLKSIGQDFQSQVDILQLQINELSGKTLNPNSPKQVAGLLYGDFGIKPILAKKKKLIKGTRDYKFEQGVSTDKQSLLQIKQQHRIIPLILEYRGLSKLLSTYIESTLEIPTMPLIYPNFNQVAIKNNDDDDMMGIRSGRLSSSNPNMQNIPTRSENGKKIRKAFIAHPGYKLICADYSQADLRILTHFSQEPAFLYAYKNNKDLHLETAAKIFNKRIDQVTEIERYRAKTINFGIVYGMQARKLALTLDISIDEAQRTLDIYWQKLPYLQAWIRNVHLSASRKGNIITLDGRRIQIDNINSPNWYQQSQAERRAVSYLIQGSTADVITKGGGVPSSLFP